MAISKVIYGNQTLIDISGDTVKAKYLVANHTAHGSDGTELIGTIPWRFVVQETLVFFDKEEVVGQSMISEAGSVTGTTLVL